MAKRKPIIDQRSSQPYRALTARAPYRAATPEELAHALDERPTKSGKSWRIRCPAHGGEDQNLAIITASDGGPAVKCYSHGCDSTAIWQAIHDRLRWEPPAIEPKRGSGRSRPLPGGPDIRTWTYRNADGSAALAVVRRDLPSGSKRISKWTPHPAGGWQPGMSGFGAALKPLYGLPELLGGDSPVIVVEGEKARDALADVAEGFFVTTWEGGTGNWQATDWSPLAARQVYLLSDADSTGRKAMVQIAQKLQTLGGSVRLWLRAGDEGTDVADDIEATPKLNVATLLGHCVEFDPDDHSDIVEDTHRCIIEHEGIEEFRRCVESLGYEVRFDELFQILQARQHGGNWETVDRHWKSRIQGEIDSKCTRIVAKAAHDEPAFRPAWFSRDRVNAGLELFRKNCRGNQFEDFLLSLPAWKGSTEQAEMSINGTLTAVFDYEPDCLLRVAYIARIMWIGPVARNFSPGIEIKLIPAIIGPPNVGKSTYLQNMLPPALAHLSSNRFNFLEDAAERYHATRGFVIVEAAEAVGLNSRAAMRYKDEVSSAVDRARPKYGSEAVSSPRRYVLVATGNRDQFELPDDDGFMVRCITAEVRAKPGESGYGNAKLVSTYLDEHRTKLWAAALHIWREKGDDALMPSPELIDNAAQAASRYRVGHQSITEFASEYFVQLKTGLGTTGGFRSWMGQDRPEVRMTVSDKEITEGFKKLAKVKSKRTRFNGTQAVFWGTRDAIEKAGLDLA